MNEKKNSIQIIKRVIEEYSKVDRKEEVSYEDTTVSLSEYLNWLKYIPENWKIPNLMNRTFYDLNDSERTIINYRRFENRIISMIEYCLNNDSNNEMTYNYYMNIINHFKLVACIPTYAKMKLTPDELTECENVIHNALYNEDEDEEATLKIKKLISNLDASNNIKDSYIKYLLYVRLETIRHAKMGTPKTLHQAKNI